MLNVCAFLGDEGVEWDLDLPNCVLSTRGLGLAEVSPTDLFKELLPYVSSRIISFGIGF